MYTSEQEIRPVREREGLFIICVNYRKEPIKLDPVEKGSLHWLREQAHQAEHDPNREWDGFEAEWSKLIAGTHPDPHPEQIIYGPGYTKKFKPKKLNKLNSAVSIAENSAYNATMSNYQPHDREYPPRSQQLFAAHCKQQLDVFLKHCE